MRLTTTQRGYSGSAGHFADFSLSSWCHLRVRLESEGVQLRYVSSLHGVGKDAGVMAITTFADLTSWSKNPEPGVPQPQDFETIQTTTDAFRFVHTESDEVLADRWPELADLLDSGLTEALARLLRRV